MGLIPARGGSKGIRRKNIVLLNEKPLISYTIEACKNSTLTDFYCTTDSEEIKKTAKGHNCKIIDRPSKLATDETSMLVVVKHFRDYLNRENVEYDAIMVLYPTHPLRDYQLINKAIETFDGTKSIIGFTKPTIHPYLYYTVGKNKSFESLCEFQIDKMYRRQSYPNNYFVITHSICIILKNEINFCNSQLYNDKSIAFIIDNPLQTIDIDSITDLKYAERILKNNI